MNKSTNLVVIIFVILFGLAFVLGAKSGILSTFGQTEKVFAAGTEEKFEYLSVQNTNSCGMQPTGLEAFSEDDSIQGSCCGAMDLHRYQEQVEGLKEYSEYDVVPEDPYDISVSLANALFEYQENITLNEEQQEVYDFAMELSHEGGPCCCRCWRWSAFEGQAKYLITENNFSAEQIAEVWDLEDGCGGSGHAIEEGH